LHCNIKSINANLDHLSQMLTEMHHNFSIIGLTETKLKLGNDNPIGINAIAGYQFVSQPSLSNAGGTGFFVSSQLSFIERNDLSEVTSDFETKWIEIECNLHHNMICGVIYRHPNSNLDSFMTSINNCLEKINNEN